MFYSIRKLTLYMHKSTTGKYNMINSKTLGIMAIFAASILVTGALIATPSYASGEGHKDKDGVSGDGNTIIIQISNGKTSANGLGTEASNTQSNSLLVNSK
jgi:hypothetical protein